MTVGEQAATSAESQAISSNRGMRNLSGSAGDNRFQDQHRRLEQRPIELGGEWSEATVNLNESPLAQLARPRPGSAVAFLTDAEFQAGERLRRDYTGGLLLPRLGVNWDVGVASARGAGNAQADLTDDALAARRRVDKAIAAVGPELAGVLVDVCCFLKGVGTVEAERRWPARSAKIVLKAALGVLSRHYAPPPVVRSTAHCWGASGFRPGIAG